jgi:hypothetical protein
MYLSCRAEWKGSRIQLGGYGVRDLYKWQVATLKEGFKSFSATDWSCRLIARAFETYFSVFFEQGVKRLAERFQPMAYAPDGLVEAFYDPDVYNPEEGKFILGLQFHPERMRHEHDVPENILKKGGAEAATATQESVFDYPECPRAYQVLKYVHFDILEYEYRFLSLCLVRADIICVSCLSCC